MVSRVYNHNIALKVECAYYIQWVDISISLLPYSIFSSITNGSRYYWIIDLSKNRLKIDFTVKALLKDSKSYKLLWQPTHNTFQFWALSLGHVHSISQPYSSVVLNNEHTELFSPTNIQPKSLQRRDERIIIYSNVASRSTSWLVTPHVTNWLQIQLVICPKINLS